MNNSEWEGAWFKHYNNRSDQRWKTKSLNPMPIQQYPIPLAKKVSKPIDPPKDSKGKQPPKDPARQLSSQGELLPAPKMTKLNETMFCISLQKQIHLFYLITNSQEKAKMKVKKVFGITTTSIKQRIEFVAGYKSKFILVGTKNCIVILQIKNQENKTVIQEIMTKQTPDLRTMLTLGTHIIAISATTFYQFEVATEIRDISTKKLQFLNKEDEQVMKDLNPVGIVIGSGHSLFYFGSRIEEKVDISKLKGAPGQTQRKIKSQALTIVKLKIQGTEKAENIRARLYPIDHIFQLGIFTRSKIYQIQQQTFLVSLHEEVIVIKENFDKYIVWDNVSVVSSKSQSKKGQLVLADKKILVYSENSEIYAHEIFFNQNESKLNMPPIDNFKGNDNDQQILYDALLLEYEDSIMKVLAYIKPSLVIYPTNDSNFKKIQTDPSKMKEDPTHLDFTIICISQSDPKRKLEQLIQKGKTNQQIEAFCQRFNISKQDETKCRWNVSQKKLKDIQNILMDISEDKYIQTELDNILKKESHNLDFLNSVQVKQIGRLKRLLVNKICQYSSIQRKDEAKKVLEYIFEIIQWLMESIMFKEKVNYSKNFLSFKEYDFIEIGKLKAASLKEQIKLLSCKKYQKRLKYFLNSFKILVISNYQQVFNFLLINKNQEQIQQFIREFNFILPNFQETSAVFIKQKDYNILQKNKNRLDSTTPKNNKKQRIHSFAIQQNEQFEMPARTIQKAVDKEKQKGAEKQKQQKCILWEPLQEGKQIAQTMEVFELMIIKEIQANLSQQTAKNKAVTKFKQVLRQFQNKPWFHNAAFKQHSMITKTTKQIHQEFKQLKRKGAFKILMKFLYHKIAEAEKAQRGQGSLIEKQVDEMLQRFVRDNFIPISFKKNVDARVNVYRQLLERKNMSEVKKIILFQLPYLQDFIVLQQADYFDFLFRNIRSKILTDVKSIYDTIQIDFFRERFQLFLQSNLITPDDIINFLDQFTEDVEADKIRIDVFSTIKRLLKLNDKQNTKRYIQKSMDREVLPEKDDNQQGKLRQQAKIPYGYYFFHFFKVFNLDYTYEQFINFTNTSMISQNKVIIDLVTRYCRSQYDISEDYNGNPVCNVMFQQVGIHQKIDEVDIHNQPLQFFGLLLHLLDVMDFQIEQKDVFQLIMESYLNQLKFKELSDFIQKLRQYHVNQYNLHTKNYQMISDFKEQIDIDRFFIDYVLGWIKKNYDSIKNQSQLQTKLRSVDKALMMINNFSKNLSTIRKQKALFDLLSYIKLFDPSLILNVEQIKQQANLHTSFVFLMHIFKKIGLDKFATYTVEQNETVKIQNLFRIFQSHKQYTQLQKVDYSHPEFIRFLIQICIVMIENNKFSMAKYLILIKIPNDKYYFKDVLLLFLAAAERDQRRSDQYKQDINKLILSPQTTSLIKNNLDVIIQKYRIASFISFKAEGKQENSNFFRRSCEMFDLILGKHRRDDAFFFLIRAKVIPNSAISANAKRYRAGTNDQYQKNRQNIELQSFFLVTTYIKALQKFIEKQFYPTYSFFESKLVLLQDTKQRKDMIKDINIAVSKLQRVSLKNEALKPQLEEIKKQLQRYYDEYMSVIGQDPNIRLVDEDYGQNTKKVEIYTRKVNKQMFEQENQQQVQYKKELQKNLEKVNQIQEDNRLNVLKREVSQRITQIKKANQRHTMLEAQIKKQDKEMNLAEKKAKQIQEIKRKEKQDIQSISGSYKSGTTKRVNDLIENLRKKRETIQAKRNAPTSAVRDQDGSRPLINIMQPPQPSKGRGVLDMLAGMQSPKSDTISENLLPITMRGKIQSNREQKTQNKFAFLDLQKKMFPETPVETNNFKKKVNFDEITTIYKNNESVDALKCIQKYDMLKNPQVRTELVKRAYSVTNNLQNLIQFLKFLINSDPSWKQSIQQKSLSIVSQMIKMRQKEKINIKDIIPAQFFTTISKVSVKDYYSIAFDILRPNLKKIFEKDMMPVHAVGILFRYTLGSQNRFYGKVFYQYFKVLLKSYELKNIDDKEMTILSQKIRSNYSSLPDTKDQVLEQLLNTITNPLKKARLLQSLKKTVDRKGQSLVGGQANKQISYVLSKMMK